MHRHHHHRDPASRPHLRLSNPFARIALGGTVAIAVLSAGAFVFGPFSDLSVLQLAAGPHATTASGSAPAAILFAHSGRNWGEAAQQRQAAAASAPLARVARREEFGTP